MRNLKTMPRLPIGKLAVLAVAMAIAPHAWKALKKGFADLGRKVARDAEEPRGPVPREGDIPTENTASPSGQDEITVQKAASQAKKPRKPNTPK